MRITIHQPDFFPWIGFFHKWAISDLFIIYDDAQFIKRGWQNRDKIRINDSELWLTVPVLVKNKGLQKINEVEINNQTNWKRKIIRTIEVNFNKSKNFNEYFLDITKIFSKDHRRLFDLNMEIIKWIGEKLKITTPIKYTSDFNVNLKRDQKILQLLQLNQATEFYTGSGTKEYIDENILSSNQIKIIYQEIDEIINYYNVTSDIVYYSVLHFLFDKFEKK